MALLVELASLECGAHLFEEGLLTRMPARFGRLHGFLRAHLRSANGAGLRTASFPSATCSVITATRYAR